MGKYHDKEEARIRLLAAALALIAEQAYGDPSDSSHDSSLELRSDVFDTCVRNYAKQLEDS